MLSFCKAIGTNHPSLYCQEFYVDKPHWISEHFEEGIENGDILGPDIKFKFQHKHNQSGIVFFRKTKCENEIRYLMKTEFPFRAITAGQVSNYVHESSKC